MLPAIWVVDPDIVIVPSAVLLACVDSSVAVALGLAAWVVEASWVVDEGGAGVSDAVCVPCGDGEGASEDLAEGFVELPLSSVEVASPSSLGELIVEGGGSTLLASAVYVIAGVNVGTPGNVLMATGCASRFASAGWAFCVYETKEAVVQLRKGLPLGK